MTHALPIDAALPDLIAALGKQGRAVLEAPPGAGKTTRVPLAMLDAGLTKGRILMLEPRRLAARAAAERMAATLGETVGNTVGYRMRGESRTSDSTRIEVVTEGILTRMLQSDPMLDGVGAVIFDEFHERSLAADLGLALCLEVADALRDDLILLVMSATLDAQPVADLMSAPRITSQGRSYPVDIRWLDRPLPSQVTSVFARRAQAMADLILQAERETRTLGEGADRSGAQGGAETGGGLLAFLPGEGEIRRVQTLLQNRLPDDVEIRPLYGSLPFAEQRKAISPATTGRKLVLATSIAETSLTLPDIRVVVDMGQARRARFDPGSGMSRLITEKVTRAEATQRTGRAGRVAAGVSYRLWTRGEEGALAAFPPAEIEAADLSPLALEMALWGAQDLPFLTAPPHGALTEAQILLRMLGALDGSNRITAHGRRLAGLPLHPRLAHMLAVAGPDAAVVAALIAGRDVLTGAPADLSLRLEALRDTKRFRDRRPFGINTGALEQAKSEAKRLRSRAKGTPSKHLSAAAMVALAYPDRVGLRRNGDAPRYLMSGGKGALFGGVDDLGGTRMIVASDLDGNPREARIRQAIPITESELRDLFPDQIQWHDLCEWSRRDRRVLARQQERFASLVLHSRNWTTAPPDALAAAMIDGVRDLGIKLSGPAARLAARVELAREAGHELPDFSPAGLGDSLEDWLLPFLQGITTADGWKRFDPLPALQAYLGWDGKQVLDRLAPGSFITPLGRKVPIDYSGSVPAISVRLQELFGVTQHPTSAGVPLQVTLLSPAQRPVQVTRDIPGFWVGSYEDVRKDMRAQYPRHPWPEDPTKADPTIRAKRRGT
jgi:ATP-dependent helicase HrpB